MMPIPDNVIAGVTDEGTDAEPTNRSAFMANLRERQEAVWAMLCHARIVVDERWTEVDYGGLWVLDRLGIYLPPEQWDWYQANQGAVDWTMANAIRIVWEGFTFQAAINTIEAEWILPIPAHLVDFVAQNTGRPMPRRYNSTAVKFTERDGITWLTPPEVIVYDLLKETSWLFVPQAAFVKGDVRRIPDFLIYLGRRARPGPHRGGGFRRIPPPLAAGVRRGTGTQLPGARVPVHPLPGKAGASGTPHRDRRHPLVLRAALGEVGQPGGHDWR
jgi:hypothetical protein